MRAALSLAAALLALPVAAPAATVGLPVFTTAPTTINVLNLFGLGGPGPYILSFGAPIAGATGAPGLVGEEVSLETNDFVDPAEFGAFSLGGRDLYAGFQPFVSYNEAANLGTLSFLLPFAGDPPDFDAFFAPFFPEGGPTAATEVELQFSLSAALPTKRFAVYCFTDVAPGTECGTDEDAGPDALAEVDGRPVEEDPEISTTYFEGQVDDVVIAFSTVGGPPVPPIPLPATAWMLVGGLGALGGLALRRRPRA